MVKICQKCGEKNFDDSKECMHCNTNLRKVKKQPYQPIRDTETGEPIYYESSNYENMPYVKRYFSSIGNSCAFISLFFYPIIFIPASFIFGCIALIKGDKYGVVSILIGFISLLVMLGILITGEPYWELDYY